MNRGLLDARARAALWCLAAVGAAAFIRGTQAAPARTWGALLIAAAFVVGLAAGALALLAMLHAAAAGWHAVLRRALEAMAGTLPLGAGLVALVVAGTHQIYHWSHEEAMLQDALLRAKAPWLDAAGFALRSAAYLALWYGGYALLRRLSRRQDEGSPGDPVAAARQARGVSAVFLVLFGVSFSFASVDWLMSVEPHWFSTIFPWYQFVGALLSALAAACVLVVVLRRRGVLAEVGPAHLHDLGKLTFAMSAFWAYLWFCQYLLIWYSNIPEETAFFVARRGGWTGLLAASLLLSFVVPFALLLPAAAKRSEARLSAAAAAILLGRAADLCVTVMPGVARHAHGMAGVESLVLFGALALFVLVFDRVFRAAPPVARRDPYLEESLGHG
ncbi:MAG: hypothetical protein HYZ75_03495 [Elusimicrobia bacterium]|nr:hypothetical protein [Elusimicrobiota bacterium]